jgi:hypothetical protein
VPQVGDQAFGHGLSVRCWNGLVPRTAARLRAVGRTRSF